jgi:hypothetical protein
MSQRPSLLVAPSVRTAAVVSVLFVLAAAAACSLLVGHNLPEYSCLPDAGPGVCPSGLACASNPAGTQFICVALGDISDATIDADGDDTSADGPLVDEATPDADAMAIRPDTGTHSCQGFGCGCAMTSDCDPGLVCTGRRAVGADIWNAWTSWVNSVSSDAGDGGGDGAIDDSGSADTGGSDGGNGEGGVFDGGNGDSGNGEGGDGGDSGGSGDSGHPDAESEGFCAEPCCTSSDCDIGAGNVCFATGKGGNYCVPPSLLGDRSNIGTASTAPGGAPCGAGTTCRSGLCLASGICADTCCSTNDSLKECAVRSLCRFGPFPGAGFDTHQTANCQVVVDAGRPLLSDDTRCATNSECRSNLCAISIGGGNPACRDACRTRSDCTQFHTSHTCNYVQPYLPASRDLVASCATGGAAGGRGGDGTPCLATADCAQGVCAQSGGQSVCLAECFADRDCAAGEHCRPQALQLGDAGYSVLACGM